MSDLAIGYIACAVSSVFFGSVFVPVKKYDSGDGNAAALPTISRLGMAVTILIWNVVNCLTGWATGRFGLFGMKAQIPASNILNYIGLVCVIVGLEGFIFSQINSTTSTENSDLKDASKDGKLTIRLNPLHGIPSSEDNKQKNSARLTGIVMALIAGVLYGLTVVPVIHMIDNPENFPGYPTGMLPYVFSNNFGIFLTSTVIFVVYGIAKKNKPVLNPEVCLPSLAAGSLWGIAQTSSFIANEKLSQVVTFPIIGMVPGCVAAAWSILYFREIQGKRNLTLFTIAMVVTLSGSTLVALSKTLHL